MSLPSRSDLEPIRTGSDLVAMRRAVELIRRHRHNDAAWSMVEDALDARERASDAFDEVMAEAQRLGVTAREVAEASGLSRAAINQAAAGSRQVLSTSKRIAAAEAARKLVERRRRVAEMVEADPAAAVIASGRTVVGRQMYRELERLGWGA
jgi:membrane protein involved in colicin uptake